LCICVQTFLFLFHFKAKKIVANRTEFSPVICRKEITKELFNIPDYETHWLFCHRSEVIFEWNQPQEPAHCFFFGKWNYRKGKSLGKNLWIDVSPSSLSFSFANHTENKGCFVKIFLEQISTVQIKEKDKIFIQSKGTISALKYNAIEV